MKNGSFVSASFYLISILLQFAYINVIGCITNQIQEIWSFWDAQNKIWKFVSNPDELQKKVS